MMFWASSAKRGATRLSWFGLCFAQQSSGFRRLARLSLAGLLLSMLSGCLVDDPPPLTPPQKTPPRLDYRKALPGLDQVFVTSFPDVNTFEIPVTSEDDGETLTAALLLDFDGLDGQPLTPGSFLPPSTLADTSRRVSLPWRVSNQIEPGCHRITLRVTHVGNTRTTIFDVIDQNDVAEAYWHANINVTPENAGSLVKCPRASTAIGSQ